MAKFDIRELNYITCGEKQNTFNLAYSYTDDGNIRARSSIGSEDDLKRFHEKKTTTLFGNIGQFDTMSEEYASNQQSLFDMQTKHMIHAVYPINKTVLQTTAKKYTNSGKYVSSQDIIAPQISADVIKLCQFQNYAYGMTEMMAQTPITLYTVFNPYASKQEISYFKLLSSDEIMTYLYHAPDQLNINTDPHLSTYKLVIDNYPELSDSIISSIFNIKTNLKNIEHNYLLEIPEGTIYNEYEKGYIQCDINVMKNHLNYLYSMEVDRNPGYHLNNCREYCDLNVCGDNLYATYRTNIDYTSDTNTITYDDTIGGINLTDNVNDDVLEVDMHKQHSDYSYQHVEIIEGINRYDSSMQAGHKTSMFSIELIDTGLKNSTIPENVKTKLRQNIKNSLRTIIDSIIPANTQLFDIYFEGK